MLGTRCSSVLVLALVPYSTDTQDREPGIHSPEEVGLGYATAQSSGHCIRRQTRLLGECLSVEQLQADSKARVFYRACTRMRARGLDIL